MVFIKFKEIIDTLTHHPIIYSSYVCKIGEKYLCEAMRSPEIHSLMFKEGKLFVNAKGSVMAMEIRINEEKFINGINERLGRILVRKIIVRQ